VLTRIDRVLVSAADAEQAAGRWRELFDAAAIWCGRDPAWAARSSVLRCGTTDVEILEPDGEGPIAERLRSVGPGLFGVGVATQDLARCERWLDEHGVRFLREATRIVVEPAEVSGLPVVVCEDVPRPRAGLLDHLFEITHLVRDGASACRRFMEVFALREENRCHFDGDAFGYRTFLPTFDPARCLDRVEFGEPLAGSAMDRFLARRGSSPYMCHGETPDVGEIRERLRARGLRFEDSAPTGGDDLLYVHPSALGGVLLGACKRGSFGIVRRDGRWCWSRREG
jgi:hypothetical protein